MVVKCRKKTKGATSGCGVEEEEVQRERPKSLVSSSSVRTVGLHQTREKVGLTLASLLVI